MNLGQGFPDFGWPRRNPRSRRAALKEGSNQYAPSRGLPALREAVAAHYDRQFGSNSTPDNVCVTSGATEALGAAILATVEPGDEVIIFTPAYDSYAPMIRRAGAMPVEVALRPPEWRIEREQSRRRSARRPARSCSTIRTIRPGGCSIADELETVAAIAREHDLIVISDEVWEHVLLDGRRFTPIATLPGMAERTIKIGSAGKIFSLTGWKVGWMVAAPELANVVARAHQFLTFATAPNLQAAVAFGLNEGDAWIQPMRDRFERSRDRMAEGLRDAGFAVLDAASTYFLCVDLRLRASTSTTRRFATAAVEQAGVAVVPLSAFAEQDPPRHLVRLCFGKKDETIDAGVAAMARAKEMLA